MIIALPAKTQVILLSALHFTSHLPRDMQDLPTSLQSYLLFTILTALVPSASPLVSSLSSFPRSLTSISMSTVPSSTPQVTSLLMARGDRFHLPFTSYLLTNFSTVQRLPWSPMAFAFSKAFSKKHSWKLYGNPSRCHQVGCPSPRKLPINSQASTDHTLKTYSPSSGYSIYFTSLSTNNLFTFRNPQALATLQNLKFSPENLSNFFFWKWNNPTHQEYENNRCDLLSYFQSTQKHAWWTDSS